MGLSAQEYDLLFTRIGKYVKSVDQFLAAANGISNIGGTPEPDLTGLLNEIIAAGDDVSSIPGALAHDEVEGISSQFDSFRSAISGWCAVLKSDVDGWLSNRNTILFNLPGLSEASSPQEILQELIRDMAAASESIDQSAVTIGAVTATLSYSGRTIGTVLTGIALDGSSEPHPGFPAVPQYQIQALDSELSVTEVLTATCIQDEDTDGLAEGFEIFRVQGQPAPDQAFGWKTRYDHASTHGATPANDALTGYEASGLDITVPTLSNSEIIANREFETFSTENMPDSWERIAGTLGTNIFHETASANVHRGASSLQYTGDAATASIEIRQVVRVGDIEPNKRHCLAVYVKGEAGTTNSALKIGFESAGADWPAASDEVSMAAAALAAQTTFGIESFQFNAPGQIPDDLELVIRLNNTPSAHSVWIDSLAFGPMVWGNGIAMAIIGAADQFLRGDRLTFTVTNDEAGTFQRFFRRAYGMQLPSAAAAGETILDSLAE